MSASTERQRRTRLRQSGQYTSLSPYDARSALRRRAIRLLIRLRRVYYDAPFEMAGVSVATFAAVSNVTAEMNSAGVATMVVTGHSADLEISGTATAVFVGGPNETAGFTSSGEASIVFVGSFNF